MYANNAEKQKAYREKVREKQLQELTDQQKPIENLEDSKEQAVRFFSITQGRAGVTYSDILQAYELFKLRYQQEFNEEYNFSITGNWLHNEEEVLLKGITVGDMTLFISCMDKGYTKCGLCGYGYSGLEVNGCPDCRHKVSEYRAWKAHRKRAGVSS
jgi:hypothetical protein